MKFDLNQAINECKGKEQIQERKTSGVVSKINK